jgi:hypothetical protein
MARKRKKANTVDAFEKVAGRLITLSELKAIDMMNIYVHAVIKDRISLALKHLESGDSISAMEILRIFINAPAKN